MHNLKLFAVSALALGLFAGGLQADEIVTTASGRSVLLKDDGTWIENKPATEEAKPQDQNEAIERIIQNTCIKEWSQDYRMRAYCERRQWGGVETLRMGKPSDISQDQFANIRQRCTGEWPYDFRMRAYCEQRQFEGVRELKSRRKVETQL
jgi:hypothetical protein